MYRKNSLNPPVRPLSLIGFGALGIQFLEHMQSDYSESAPQLLNYLTLSSNSVELEASMIDQQIFLEIIPDTVKSISKPKSWLSQTHLDRISKFLDGSVLSLIFLDANDLPVHLDYAHAVADLSRSKSLITIVALFGDSDVIISRASELHSHADLVLEMPNLNTKPWFSLAQYQAAYQKITDLVHMCTKFEPATIPYDFADLRCIMKTEYKSEVLIKSIDGSLEDETFLDKLKQQLGEGAYPLSKRFNKILFHCTAGSDLTLNWIFEHVSYCQSQCDADQVICAVVDGQNYFPQQVKLTLLAVV